MQSKLILVEGIPGSGKTTTANKIVAYYRDNGVNATAYIEGDAHPADLGWIACIPQEHYNSLLARYPQLAEDIKVNTQIEHGHRGWMERVIGFSIIARAGDIKALTAWCKRSKTASKLNWPYFRPLVFQCI